MTVSQQAAIAVEKNIGVLAVVIPELEFSHLQRLIFAAELVMGADDAALEGAPKSLQWCWCERRRQCNCPRCGG